MTQIEVRFYELASSFFSKMLHPSKAKDDIDWEQRRYEIAKDIFAQMSSNGVHYPTILAADAVKGANALIEELKK